jgi:hypothetical protein
VNIKNIVAIGVLGAALAAPMAAEATQSRYWLITTANTCGASWGYVNNNDEVLKGNVAQGRYRSVVSGKNYSTWRVGFKYNDGTQAYSNVGPLNTQSAQHPNSYTNAFSNPFIRNTSGGSYEASACYEYN